MIMSSELISFTGEYKHKNGGVYEVIDIARNSNDYHQILVIYKNLKDGDFPSGTTWVRPYNDFMKEGRFTKIKSSEINVYCQSCLNAEATMQDDSGEYLCSDCYFGTPNTDGEMI